MEIGRRRSTGWHGRWACDRAGRIPYRESARTGIVVSIDREEGGKVFREAWIEGVTTHYAGTPKDSFITPWEDTPDWEKASAAAVYQQVAEFIRVTNGAATRLSPETKGQFVAICWVGQIYARIPDPKPGYVAPWEQLPEWQQRTDIGIFEAVERDVAGAEAFPLNPDPRPTSES